MSNGDRRDAGNLSLAFREERVPVAEIAEAGRERFDLLFEVGKKVLSASSLDDLNQLALTLVFDCVRAERGALLLRDRSTGGLVSRVARHRERGALEATELRVPRSIVDEVVSGRLGILTSDAVHDPRFEARQSIRISNIRSALCAPLWDGEEVLGVVYLDSRVHTYAFTREDLVLLNAIANLIAIRLKQETLYDQLTRERIVRSNLERYHSPAVARAILARAKEPGQPEVGLEERDVTILFGDVEGFTLFAESQPPSAVADFLGRYYDIATRAMFAHGGTVMEFVGDSVMAIFGAPVPQSDHAPRAIRAGLQLLREVRGGREGGTQR
ncbi:MAG: adenylate/guanylate cyclase domain-containing protein, partial [Myxococcota bacterium]